MSRSYTALYPSWNRARVRDRHLFARHLHPLNVVNLSKRGGRYVQNSLVQPHRTVAVGNVCGILRPAARKTKHRGRATDGDAAANAGGYPPPQKRSEFGTQLLNGD